ncbi:hypothetical protein HJC23_002788 [Cyclotella cryptica]|uniref:RmlD-like substrate binding domain-containing protein n=1 Tax=Cyclotella cryptica TaxID=29204 RepID=A0ABD3PFD0_9STRA|eukprot:CCRYP_015037-RA/>CCRYP_015037-RA protein AED:0.02 eAED:-0.01 QI:0/-1/0/1/-1/1/1/0/384
MTTLETSARGPKKILITGSSGYIGQHLIASLARDGIAVKSRHAAGEDEQYEVFCGYRSLPTFETDLDQLVRETLALHPSIAKIKAFQLDFESDCLSAIRRACGESVDVIIHLAALSSPVYCELHPDEAWKINVPLDLLSFGAPIIYMSTDQVYQGTQKFYRENDDTLPVNVYGKTKLAFERLLLLDSFFDRTKSILTDAELQESDLPDYLSPVNLKHVKPNPRSVILRSSLVLGKPAPFRNGCNKGAFPSFLQFVESRLKSSTSTNYFINEFRSVVHVEDVVFAILHFTRQALARGNHESASMTNDKVRIFNLGGSDRVSRHDLAMKVATHLKLDATNVSGVDRPVGGGGVPSPADISMNVEKLTMEMSFDKMDGLEEIVNATF